MSSESASSGMAQKEINIDLVDGKLVIRESAAVMVDMTSPKLNIGKLYESLFSDVDEPISMEVKYSNALKSDRKAVELANSIKTIIDDASEKINDDLAIFLASSGENREDDQVEEDEHDKGSGLMSQPER